MSSMLPAVQALAAAAIWPSYAANVSPALSADSSERPVRAAPCCTATAAFTITVTHGCSLSKVLGKGKIAEVEELKAAGMADVGGQAAPRRLMRHFLKAWPAK